MSKLVSPETRPPVGPERPRWPLATTLVILGLTVPLGLLATDLLTTVAVLILEAIIAFGLMLYTEVGRSRGDTREVRAALEDRDQIETLLSPLGQEARSEILCIANCLAVIKAKNRFAYSLALRILKRATQTIEDIASLRDVNFPVGTDMNETSEWLKDFFTKHGGGRYWVVSSFWCWSNDVLPDSDDFLSSCLEASRGGLEVKRVFYIPWRHQVEPTLEAFLRDFDEAAEEVEGFETKVLEVDSVDNAITEWGNYAILASPEGQGMVLDWIQAPSRAVRVVRHSTRPPTVEARQKRFEALWRTADPLRDWLNGGQIGRAIGDKSAKP